MGKRRNSRKTRSFWGTEVGGMPAWALVAAAVVVLAIAGVSVAAIASKPPTPVSASIYTPPVEPPTRYALMFGDSYFNGSYPVDTESTFASKTAHRLGYFPLIRGNGGTGFIGERTVEPAAPNYLAQAAEGELNFREAPEVIVIQGGLLDQRFMADEVAASALDLITQAKNLYPDAGIFVLGPPNPYSPESEGVRRAESGVRSAAEQAAVPFIAFTDLMSHDELVQHLAEDGIHPTQEGHDILTDRLAAALVGLGVPDLSSP